MRIGPGAEVTAVGVQRLGAGHAQDNAAEGQQPCDPWSIMKRAPHVGDSPCSTPGCSTTSCSPRAADHAKNTRITGPNIHPTAPVPNRCTTNSPSRIASDERHDQVRQRLGVATLSAFDRPR